MPTWGVFRVGGLRLNWLCLWVCISLDPSSGSSPFSLMMRLVFCLDRAGESTWEEKCVSKECKDQVKAKGIDAEVSSQSANSWINMLFLMEKWPEICGVLSQDSVWRLCESNYLTCMLCMFQECDQVHIDDVSSDDNGQDLRYNTGTPSKQTVPCPSIDF